MQHEFELLKDTIKELSHNEPVIYVPNGGNWGDALIREATLMFFADNSIAYYEIPPHNLFWTVQIKTSFIEEFLRDKVLVYGGGGAWYQTFGFGASFVGNYYQYFRKVIVLPSTLMKSIEAKNTTFFCRDHFESKQYYPDAKFCHDMAFYMKDALQKSSSKGNGSGYFLRYDEESSNQLLIPESNIDISSFGNEVTPIIPFISKINEYSIIHTDRLHVAITACLLNKQLYFYKGSYFKNEAVYHSSIKNNFENTLFFNK